MKVSIDWDEIDREADDTAGYDFGAGLEALWEGAKLAPANTLASFAQAYQGATLNDGGPVEEFIQGVKLRNEEYLADDGDNLSKLVPLPGDDITVGTEKQALGSAGFTLAGMLSSAVGGAAGTATRIPGMGYVGAALTSLPVLQRAAANEALRAIRDVVSGPFEEENGRKMDAIDWLPLEEQYRATANEKGFNEAWPEMLGNLLTFGIIRAKSIPLVSNALKGVVAKSPKLFKGLNVLGKYGAIAGTEVGTEAVTEKFNREADIKAGLETDPLSWGEAVQSVAPVSLTMSGLTAGFGGGLSLAYDKTIGRDSIGKPKKTKDTPAPKTEKGGIADMPTEAELETLLAEITEPEMINATVVPEAHRMDAQNLQAEQSAQAELGEALATVEKANAEEATAQELNAALETVEREEGPQKFLGEGVDATDYPLIDSQDIPADAVLVGYDLDLNYIYQGVDETIYRAQERRPEKAFATQQILDDTETSQTQEQRDADFQREINRAEHGVTRGIKVGDALDPRLDPNLGIDQQELIITDAMVMDGIEADLNNGSAPTRGYAGVENYTDGGYPDWFSNKGYNKKDSLHAIDLARNRKPMTLIQKALLADLMNGKRSELKLQQNEYINTVRADRLTAIRAENDAAQSQADLAVEREAIQDVELGQTNNELQVLEDQNRQREAEITARELDAREQVLNGETVTEEITETQPQEEVGEEGQAGEIVADLPSVETVTAPPEDEASPAPDNYSPAPETSPGLTYQEAADLATHIKDIGGQNIDIIPMDEIVVDTSDPVVRERLQAHGLSDDQIEQFSAIGGRVSGAHRLKRATTGELRSIIKLSLRDADTATGYHEVMHRIIDLALDGKQVDFLLKKFGSVENIADEYGARLDKLRSRKPMGQTEVIFAKIMEFIESIRNFATAKGWNSESRLAREIDEGVYAEVADNADITPTTERFSLTRKTEGDAITGQVNTSMADVDLKYDGAQLNIRDEPVYHLFTVYAGPAQGATFTSKELTFDAVQTALNTKIAQFEQSYALPAHATNRGAYAANLVSEIKGIQSSLATATPAESKDLAAQLQAKAEELQTLVADYKDTPDAAETVAEVDPRSVGVKLFKDRDRAEHYAKVDADTMEREVQRLADSTRGRKGPFAMDIVKASDKSRFLSRAMMIYRDLKNFESEGGNIQEKVAWGLSELNKKANATKNKVTKKKILDKIKIIQASQVLTIEQKEFVDNMVDAKFKEVEALAIDNDLIKEGKDNYVRRIWSLTDADGASYESSGSNGFKVTTKAGEKRTLDTIIDGWERGYELKAGMIQNSYREIATEIGTIASNKGFLRWGLSEKTPDGDPLFTTKKLQGYAPLTASGFQVYTPAGKVEIGVEGEPGDIRSYGDIELESDSYGRRVFITKPQGAMKDSVIVFAPAQIYAPKEVADVINKMTDGKSALREIPAISKALDITSALKGWILMVSLFHHRAGATSWLFGVPHGGQINFVKAYKNGIQKIRDKADIVDLGVRNGLTLYGNQDHQEMFKGDTSVITNVIEKYNLDSINKIAEVAGKIRGGYADALFNKFFAGLKAEAFDKTFNKVLKANPTQDQEVLAEQVATVINADFGGLHLGRMGRNKTVQDILRLGLLAPDWSESNFRTVFGMIPGNKLNKFVDKMMDGVPAVKGMETHYREFWLRAAVGIIMTTGIAQFLAAGGDPEEVYEFHKQMFNQWEKGRNLAVDITPFYRMMGIDIPENQKMTFSIAGHFADPLKLADPARLIKGKESPGMRIVESLLTGSDWAERPYTSFSQLLAGEGTIKKSRFQQKEGSLSRLASTTLNTMMNMQPIAIGNMVKVIMGDEDPLTGVLASSGMHIGRTWLKDESNERYNEAREKILKYNRDVKGLDDEAKTQLQKDIFGTAGEYLRVKEQYKRVKSGLRALNKRFDAVEGTDAEHGVKEDISALKDNFAEVVTSGVGAISAPSTGRSLKGRSLSTRSLKPRTLRR